MAKDAQVSFIIVAKDAATKAIGNVNRALSGLKKGTVFVGKAFLAMGAAAVAGITALAGAIGYAVKQAAEEEAGIKRLTTALKANVKGRVDMGKVEAQVAKQQRELAFSDGEIRDSLAALIPFTKNTKKAFEAQSIAADLARMKNMDLTAASKQIGLAMTGNTRVLKQLGIELPKTASKAQILAAIQKKVAGQSEAYAESTEGQFTILKNSLDDLVEDIGTAFLPIANQLVKWANDSLMPAIQAALPGIIEFGKGFLAAASVVVQNLLPAFFQLVDWVTKNVIPVLVQLAQTFFGKGGIAESVMGVVGPIAQNLLPIFGEIAKVIAELIIKIGEFVGVLWGDGNGPLAIAVKAIGAALGIVAKVIQTIIQAVITAIDMIQRLIELIANSPLGDLAGGIGDLVSGIFGGGKAKGGPVSAGKTYLVGEKGPELFRPGVLGSIVPNSALQPAAAITMRPSTVVNAYVTLDGREIATNVNSRLGRLAAASNGSRNL